MTTNKFIKEFFLVLMGGLIYFALMIPVQADEEVEEIVSIGSFLDSKELDASPVDVISNEEFKLLRLSTVAEVSKYLSVASGSHFQSNSMDGIDQGMASITLRGLDHASTLVLINRTKNSDVCASRCLKPAPRLFECITYFTNRGSGTSCVNSQLKQILGIT